MTNEQGPNGKKINTIHAGQGDLDDSDKILCILHFLDQLGENIPGDTQSIHLAFEKLTQQHPEMLGHLRFVPDPVVPRSEKLEVIFRGLRFTHHLEFESVGVEPPTQVFTKAGKGAVEGIIIPKIDDEALADLTQAAQDLALTFHDWDNAEQ